MHRRSKATKRKAMTATTAEAQVSLRLQTEKTVKTKTAHEPQLEAAAA
jgi:hypothetical protein